MRRLLLHTANAGLLCTCVGVCTRFSPSHASEAGGIIIVSADFLVPHTHTRTHTHQSLCNAVTNLLLSKTSEVYIYSSRLGVCPFTLPMTCCGAYLGMTSSSCSISNSSVASRPMKFMMA